MTNAERDAGYKEAQQPGGQLDTPITRLYIWNGIGFTVTTIYPETLRAAVARGYVARARNVQEAEGRGIRTAFLCHSHWDQALAIGLLNLVAERGLELYVEWNDMQMPTAPNRETAKRIQTKIKEVDPFPSLATSNSLKSRWCPWEHGNASAGKEWARIVLIQVAERNEEWPGREYLQLYRSLECTQSNNLALFDVG